jgi:hypothetical protein
VDGQHEAVALDGAMGGSPEWSLRLAPVALFSGLGPTRSTEHWVLTSGIGGRWRVVRWCVLRRASFLGFGIDGERLQGSFGPDSSPGGSGGVSSSSIIGQTRLGCGETIRRRAARGELDRVLKKGSSWLARSLL